MMQDNLQELVNKQAEDEWLWFVSETATESYLQEALRQLHALIEARLDLDELIRKPDYVQLMNPRSKRYVKIDRTIGHIVASKKSPGPYKNIPVYQEKAA